MNSLRAGAFAASMIAGVVAIAPTKSMGQTGGFVQDDPLRLVVQILSPQRGYGVIVSWNGNEGRIVTCNHVVTSSSPVAAHVAAGRDGNRVVIEAETEIRRVPNYDLAVLTIRPSPDEQGVRFVSLPFERLRAENRLKVADGVYTLEAGLVLHPQPDGVVTKTEGNELSISTKIATDHGSSGSPVFDAQKKVAGIMCWGGSNRLSKGRAIAFEYVLRKLEDLNVPIGAPDAPRKKHQSQWRLGVGYAHLSRGPTHRLRFFAVRDFARAEDLLTVGFRVDLGLQWGSVRNLVSGPDGTQLSDTPSGEFGSLVEGSVELLTSEFLDRLRLGLRSGVRTTYATSELSDDACNSTNSCGGDWLVEFTSELTVVLRVVDEFCIFVGTGMEIVRRGVILYRFTGVEGSIEKVRRSYALTAEWEMFHGGIQFHL